MVVFLLQRIDGDHSAGTVGLEGVAKIGSSLQRIDGDHSAGTVGLEGVATIESSLQPIDGDHSAGTVGLEGVATIRSFFQPIRGDHSRTVRVDAIKSCVASNNGFTKLPTQAPLRLSFFDVRNNSVSFISSDFAVE